MSGFDFANATFIRSGGGPWELDRDWNEYPATPLEVEALFAHLMLLEFLLEGFVRRFAAGCMQTADGLDGSSLEEVMRLIGSVSDIAQPPTERAQ